MKELKPSASDSRLGRDFWVFQTGQTISTVGGSCGNIALAWWILDHTVARNDLHRPGARHGGADDTDARAGTLSAIAFHANV
jgi:hypothetical protein